MIAMALVCRPTLLIADEPTTALDVTVQAQILKLLQDLKRDLDMSMLFITHDLGVVANIADEVVVMFRGRVMETGPRESLLDAPQHPYLQALLHAVPTLYMSPDDRLATLRPTKKAPESLQKRNRRTKESGEILAVRGLEKTFCLRSRGASGFPSEIKAVDDVSFSVQSGECFAIVGESGSGKTTVSKMIMRALRPDRGEITYNSADGPIDVLSLNETELLPFRRSIQYIFQGSIWITESPYVYL